MDALYHLSYAGLVPKLMMERVMGIEPTWSAWKAGVLPLNYTRIQLLSTTFILNFMVEGGGFEPPKAEPSDLQSDPFGHSGTPPRKQDIIRKIVSAVNH